MKKFLALILAAVMVCMMVPAVAEVTAETFTGAWYLTKAVNGDEEMDGSLLASNGVEISLSLNEDGTAELISSLEGGEPVQGTWKLADNGVEVTIDGEPLVFPFADGLLEMPMDGGSMFLGREKPVVETIAPATAAEGEDAFLGAWVVSKVEISGIVLKPDMLLSVMSQLGVSEDAVNAFISLNLAVEPGKLSLKAGTLTLGSVDTSFGDGKLKITVPEAVEGEVNGVQGILGSGERFLELAEDGSLILTLEFAGTPFVMNFVQQPEA